MKKAGYIFFLCFISSFLAFSGCSSKSPSSLETPRSCSYAFGNNLDNDDASWAGGYLFACPFTISSGMNVSKLCVKLSYAANFTAGIYSDNAGSPADLISQAGVVSGVPGWNTATAAAVDLNAGVKYWLVTVTESPGVSILSGSSPCKYSLVLWSAYSSGLPADLGAMMWSEMTNEIKIYAVSCN